MENKSALPFDHCDHQTSVMIPNLEPDATGAMELNISQLPNHVLTNVVQYLPLAQWPAMESVDRSFQNATFEAWKKLRHINLEADFICNQRLFAENKISMLNMLLEKLSTRARKITGFDGFDEFKDLWLGESSIDLLAEFSHLEDIRFSGIRISYLVGFLNTTRSRNKLRKLDLTDSLLPQSMVFFSNILHGEAELQLAFGQHADLPPLELEYFGYKFGYADSPCQFLNNIDATNLNELCLDVADANQENVISILNRCNKLVNLKLKMRQNSMQILQSITLPHTLSKLTLEYYAINPERHASLKNFIGNHDRDPYRLTELCLSGNHCRDDTVQYIAHNYQHLRSLWLDISVCEVDTVAHLLLAKSERLENLQLRGVNPYCTTAIAPYISQLKNLKYLDISAYSLYVMPEGFAIALCNLDQLKELSLIHTHIKDESITHLIENAHQISQLELLDITSSDVSEAGIISLLQKLPNLRKLNLGNTKITDDVLNALAKSCPFLLELNIPIGNITPVGMQSVIDNLPRLKKIRLDRVIEKEKWYPHKLQINKYRKVIFK